MSTGPRDGRRRRLLHPELQLVRSLESIRHDHTAFLEVALEPGAVLRAAGIPVAAGGALSSVETTVLMTVEETMEALAKGKSIGYRKPGA